ncbi:ATP-binding protein [Priestia flexa]|uniref:AAA family ATPase n=1 Tax=Priestia flexa TaxID=86664 RepID=UPI00203C0C18|nr:AAA family ATPase [Priestia flexa]MCM3068275.1 ATP-binding protein [Priestia flexa]
MQLESLFIKEYKLLRNCTVVFVPEGGYPNHYYDYFSNNNFTILVGENGNGKTTLMSFIARVFNDLQRYHDRISSDFCLKYKIEHNQETKAVKIEKENDNLFITVENSIPKSVLLELNPQQGYIIKENQIQYENKVTYDEIRSFLPTTIITSVFSFHGEYPSERPSNFIGDRIIENYDIAKVYGANHYGFSSLSKGISRFIETYRNNTDIVNELLSFLNLKFGNKILIRERFTTLPSYGLEIDDDEEFDEIFSEEDRRLRDEYFSLEKLTERYSNGDDNWVKVCEENYDLFLRYEKEEIIYMNDIAFEKNGELISLENMSSGEKMFFMRILSLLSSIEDNSLIIIEEPELHLNPSWNKQIITMLQMLFGNYKVHFLISTHSYAFINTVFPENILFANQRSFINPDPNINTFLANEVEISNLFFANSKKINYVENRLWKKVGEGSEDELEEILGYLGESYTKFKLFNIMLGKQGNKIDVED